MTPLLPPPNEILRSVFEITPDWLEKRGLSAVFADLDNTLAGYGDSLPDASVVEWIRSLELAGIRFAVISNGKETRVARFCGQRFPYVSSAKKPRPDTLINTARAFRLEPSRIVMTGDQIRTDIASGVRAGMYTALVDPFSPRLWFRLRRAVENFLAGIQHEYTI